MSVLNRITFKDIFKIECLQYLRKNYLEITDCETKRSGSFKFSLYLGHKTRQKYITPNTGREGKRRGVIKGEKGPEKGLWSDVLHSLRDVQRSTN